MAGNIKGITIEFDGDTSKLDKALKDIRKQAGAVDRELKAVNRALKFNPRNLELLAQKQTLLRQKVSQTEKSLKDLTNVQKQLDAKGVDKNSEAYRKVRREIIQTESKLKHFKGELAKTAAQGTKLYRVGQALEDAGKRATAAGQALRGLSRAAAGVTVAIGAATYKAATMADDLNTLSKQTGISTYDLQMYAAQADLVDVSVEAMARSQKKLKRSMLTAKGGGSTLTYFEQLGVAVVDADGNLRDSNDVFNDTIKALGQMENETERDAIAMALFGKSASDLNPLIEDQGHTYERVSRLMKENGLEPVSQEALDRANKFKDLVDTIKLVMTQAVQIVGTKIAGYLVPVMEKVTGAFTKLASMIAGLSGGTLAKLGGLSAVTAMLSPLLLLVGAMATRIGAATKSLAVMIKKVPGLGKAFKFLKANPIILIATALAGLALQIGKSGKAAEDIVKIFDNVLSKITARMPEIIQKVIDIVKQVAATIAKNAPLILQGLMTLMTAILQAIPTYAPMILQGAINLFSQFVKAIPVIVPQVLAAVKSLVVTVAQNLPALAGALLSAVGSLARTLLSSFKGVFSGVVSWMGSIFGQAWQAVKNKFSGWGSFWSGLWGQVKNKFRNIGSAIGSAIHNAITGGLNAVISKVESIINKGVSLINKGISLINKVKLGKDIGYLEPLHLPRLAEGGVLNGARAVIAGEAGPEAIIPLDKLFRQMDKMAAQITGAGEGVTVNVYASAGMDVEALARAIEERIINTQKRRRLAWQ